MPCREQSSLKVDKARGRKRTGLQQSASVPNNVTGITFDLAFAHDEKPNFVDNFWDVCYLNISDLMPLMFASYLVFTFPMIYTER